MKNGHSLLFSSFIKKSFLFSAPPCGIWPLLCISTGPLAQAGFLLLLQGKVVLASPLVSGLVPFPAISGHRLCWPSSSSILLLLLTRCRAYGGCTGVTLPPTGTDSFASTPLSVQVTFAWDHQLKGFLTLLQRLNGFASCERRSREALRVLLLVPTKGSFSRLSLSGCSPVFHEHSWQRTCE